MLFFLLSGMLRRIPGMRLGIGRMFPELEPNNNLPPHEQPAQEPTPHHDRSQIQDVALLRPRRVHDQDGRHARLSARRSRVTSNHCETGQYSTKRKGCFHCRSLKDR